MITVSHLRKAYPNAVPLKDVSVTINDGDIISVIGPSGTGKSTLIRCLNLLDKPTSGTITVGDTEITAKGCRISEVRKKMGMVFQSFNLFGHLTVIENVMRPQMDLLGTDRQTAYDKAMELLHMVGMEGRAMNYPDMLSGGQKQRVAIARTLAMDPEIILFDEPTSALDPTMVGEVQAVIRDLAAMGKTMMIVTHEMRFAREICNRVFYMDQGGIYEDGTPEQIFDHPQKELTRRFIRGLKVFETAVTGTDYDFLGTVSALDAYGFKNRIAPRLVSRVRLIFEEVCGQMLMKRLTDPRILFTVEYSEREEQAEIIIRFSGGFDPLAAGEDELSENLVKNLCREIRYEAVTENEYTDALHLLVR